MNVCHSDSNSILSFVFSSRSDHIHNSHPRFCRFFSVCARCHFAFAHCGSFHFSFPVSSCHPKATKYKNEKKTVCLWVKRFFIDFSSVFSMFSSQTFKYQTISYSFGTKKCWCFSHINEYAWCLYVWSLHELFFFLWACNHMRTAGNIHHFISSFR